ncbi:UDP-3-O-(3-hydroxymyristoyl)glucosamine N-acyltransferase [Stieleria varia]|nr:UDP-3-O-(3-hydroxymyristoyl)glucosamine N-acyltransferase [Stieleria varia]
MIQLQELAWLVGGQLLGDGEVQCVGANPPDIAGENEITMIDDVSKSGMLQSTKAIAVVTPAVLSDCELIQVVVPDVHQAFTTIVSQYRPPVRRGLPGVGVDSSARIAPTARIHPTATVCAGAKIGQRTIIMPGVVILPHCSIGDDCTIHASVTLYEYTEIGDRVTVHAGTVLGANGFGYRQINGRHVSTAQLGFVRIGSDVEIGAAVTIDRGTYGATSIGEGTKIDNQVMIAHNCQIGRHNLLCSQVGIAGSCRTGDYVILAGQVGLKDHITLGDHTIVGAQAGVMDDCKGNEVYLGSPATSQREQMQIMAVQRRLPEMRREIKALRRELEMLTRQPKATIDINSKNRKAA